MIPRVRPSFTKAEMRALLLPTRDAARELERGLAKGFGMRDAILFPYGRSAIYGVLCAMGLRGEIVQPAYNCVVVAHAAVMAECPPVFVDCERDTPNQDADAMIDAVNEKTTAVIPTSIFGHTFDAPLLVDRIRRKNPKAFVLMDCAQAFTPDWNGELLAAQGDAAVLAFGIGKAMTTLFGGAVLTNRADVAQKIRAWQKASFSTATFTEHLKRILYFFAAWGGTTEGGTILADRVERSRAMSSALVKQMRSREVIRLPKTNLSYLDAREASIGIAQLPRLDSFLERRRVISHLYENELNQVQGVKVPRWRDGSTHTIYTLRLEEPSGRERLLDRLRTRGVQGGTTLDYIVPTLDCYRELGYADTYPNAREWAERALNLPNHPTLTDAQVRFCARALRDSLEKLSPVTRSAGHHVRESIS